MSNGTISVGRTSVYGVCSSLSSIEDACGGVNIGYMPCDAYVADVVGDDVRYEASWSITDDLSMIHGMGYVSPSVRGTDGSEPARIPLHISQFGGGRDIGLSRVGARTADCSSAYDGMTQYRVCLSSVNGNVDTSKGQKSRHLLKRSDSTSLWRDYR
jgi:hypothetical protein